MYLKLSVHYTDGSKYTVVSDTTWGVTGGPLQMSDIYTGETYDARYVGWRAFVSPLRLPTPQAHTSRTLLAVLRHLVGPFPTME